MGSECGKCGKNVGGNVVYVYCPEHAVSVDALEREVAKHQKLRRQWFKAYLEEKTAVAELVEALDGLIKGCHGGIGDGLRPGPEAKARSAARRTGPAGGR